MGRWVTIIREHVKPILQEFKNRGLKPTVRGMFYILVESKVIPKDQKLYSGLVRALSHARKIKTIKRDAFSDNTRQIIQDFDDRYFTVDEMIDNGLKFLKNIPHNYKDNIPTWHKQPNYVEVWLEKDAMTGVLASLIGPLQVILVPNRGWRSITFVEKG